MLCCVANPCDYLIQFKEFLYKTGSIQVRFFPYILVITARLDMSFIAKYSAKFPFLMVFATKAEDVSFP